MRQVTAGNGNKMQCYNFTLPKCSGKMQGGTVVTAKTNKTAGDIVVAARQNILNNKNIK